MTLHTKLSYVKSGARMLGYLILFWNVALAAAVLFASECIGIAEEAWPGAYKGTETSVPVETAATVNEKLKNVTFN